MKGQKQFRCNSFPQSWIWCSRRLSSSLSATKHRKPLERDGDFFLGENGGSGNGAWGKQAVESILKASAPPPHPLSFHCVGSVGMFFIRRGLFTGLQPLHESVSVSERERVRERRKVKHLFIGIWKLRGPETLGCIMTCLWKSKNKTWSSYF